MPDERYRTFWRRAFAGFIDALVLLPLSWADRWVWASTSWPIVLVPWFVSGCLAGFAYSVVLHGCFGQTIGKRLTGVRVYDLSGQKLSMWQALLRDSVPLFLTLASVIGDLPTVVSGTNPYDPATFAMSGLSFLQRVTLWGSLVWVLLELGTMLTNRRRRAIHDLIAGSVVMRINPVVSMSSEIGGGA